MRQTFFSSCPIFILPLVPLLLEIPNIHLKIKSKLVRGKSDTISFRANIALTSKHTFLTSFFLSLSFAPLFPSPGKSVGSIRRNSRVVCFVRRASCPRITFMQISTTPTCTLGDDLAVQPRQKRLYPPPTPVPPPRK